MSDRLEDYIVSSFSALKLEIPEDDIKYIARLVEEDTMDDADKAEGIKGMIEGFGEAPADEVDAAIDDVLGHWRGIKEAKQQQQEEEEEQRRAKEEDGAGSGDGDGSDSEDEQGDAGGKARRKALLDSLTPEEKAAAQRRALLAEYGYVEDPSANAADLDGPKGENLKKREEEKAKEERRLLIEKAIREEGRRRKKKYRQAQEVDLLAPNLNREKVQYKQQLQREAARNEAQAKRDRDRAALEKQRADQAKALADKRKKAQKGERRA